MNPRSVLAAVAIIVVTCACAVPESSAQSVTLAWDAALNASGYRVSYGTQSGVYTSSLDAGSQTSLMVSNLTPGTLYYFTAQSYDSNGTLSTYAAETTWIVPITASRPLRTGLDLNGDNLADVFAFDPLTGEWSNRYATGTGKFNTGPSGGWAVGWSIFPGDFNADGETDFLLYNVRSGAFAKAINNGSGTFTYFSGGWAPNWSAYVLDLNGDSRSDVFLYNKSTGAWYKCISIGDGTGTFSYYAGGWAPGWELFRANFDGNGSEDFFLYSRQSGTWYKALSDGAAGFTYSSGTWANDWDITIADLDGDGRSDVFLYNKVSGLWYRCISNATASGFAYTAGMWAGGWNISPADWDDDGRSDLLLYSPSLGYWYKALNDGVSSFSYVGGVWARWSTWIADLNGDGRTDVFLYDPNSGVYYQALSTPAGFAYHPGSWKPGLQPVAAR